MSEYVLTIHASIRTAGSPDPERNHSGIPIPRALARLVGHQHKVVTPGSFARGMPIDQRQVLAMAVMKPLLKRVEEEVRNEDGADGPNCSLSMPEDPLIADSDINVGTPDKPIWKPYSGDSGITLLLEMPDPASTSAHVRTMNYGGVRAAWFLHCRFVEPSELSAS